MKFKKVVPVMFAGVALGLGVVACGGDDKKADSTPAATATAAATEARRRAGVATSRSRSAPRRPTTAG